MEEEEVKRCFKCGEFKPLSAFYRHPKMSDGHVNKCKECNKSDVIENRLKNLEYYREYDRNRIRADEFLIKRNEASRLRYAEDEGFKLSVLAAKERWASANKNKRLAQCAVGNALRDNRLTKPCICSCCSSKANKIYGHHWSYAEEHWFDVLWLCSKCHGREHRRINKNRRDGVDAYYGVKNSEDAIKLLLKYVSE